MERETVFRESIGLNKRASSAQEITSWIWEREEEELRRNTGLVDWKEVYGCKISPTLPPSLPLPLL